MANEYDHHHSHQGSMPVEEAIEAAGNWRAYLDASNSGFDLKSFWISMEHIKNILEHNPDADGIRTYLGLEDPADPASFKFVIVPTKHGIDVVERHNGKSNVAPPPIYCPPICPTGGVLNG